MKISIFGAGNVGSLAAMRIAQYCLGDVVMVDVLGDLAKGKALDLEDARSAIGSDYHIRGSNNIEDIKGSGIVVITAGLARRPGMTREELLAKNSSILKDISAGVKKLAPEAIVIVVTNPLDLMTYLVLKVTGFKKQRVIGMGVSLDASRFANIIAQEMKVPVSQVNAFVMGAHGESMLPLPSQTRVCGEMLSAVMDKERICSAIKSTVNRGAEIVSALGSGSAFFAPSAAIAEMVKVIALDKKEVVGACAFLEGEYGERDVCMGVPCCLGKDGIEKIIEFNLSQDEKDSFRKSVNATKELIKGLPL